MGVAELPYPSLPGGLSLSSGGGGASVWLLDDDTQLRIVSCNAAAGVTVGLQGLRLDELGNPRTIVETHTPTTTRAVNTQNYKIGRGTLLRLTAFVTSGVPLYGQTYVLAQLIRGVSGPTQVLATLIGGYITVNQALGFPGSPVRSSIDGGGYMRMIAGTTPAAGVEISEAVPTNARWELLGLNITLTSSAAPGTRRPRVFLRNSARVPTFAMPVNNLAASQVWNQAYGQNMPLNGLFTLSTGTLQGTAPIPLGSLLLAGDSWETNTDGLLAGDQWAQPTYLVREWLEF